MTHTEVHDMETHLSYIDKKFTLAMIKQENCEYACSSDARKLPTECSLRLNDTNNEEGYLAAGRFYLSQKTQWTETRGN